MFSLFGIIFKVTYDNLHPAFLGASWARRWFGHSRELTPLGSQDLGLYLKPLPAVATQALPLLPSHPNWLHFLQLCDNPHPQAFIVLEKKF